MLNQKIQEQLAKRDGGERLTKMVKEAFDQRLTRALKEEFKEEREAYAAVAFADIAGFSSTVVGWTATQVRTFLDDYYAAAIPPIYDSEGVIDRIVGDGILSVYSEYFDPAISTSPVRRRWMPQR